MRTRFFIALLTLSAFLHPLPSLAQGIPVYDAAGYGQIVSQLNQMSKDYQKQLEQLDQAIRQANAVTGTRNMGALANSAVESGLRRYLPNTWQDTLQIMEAANLSNSALGTQSLYGTLYKTYSPMTGAELITQDPTGPIAQAIDRRTRTAYGAMAASEQAYNNAADRLDTYETLLREIDKTEDLKASVDLQARIAAENGMSLNELMRLQAIQIQQKAADDNALLTDDRRASAANRFDAAKAALAFTLQE